MDNLMIREGFVGQRMIRLPTEVRAKLKKNVLTRFFYPTDLGYYPNADHHYRARKKGAKEFIFIYCTKGEGRVRVGKQDIRVPPNHFVIIPKLTDHQYGSSEANPWTIYWMHFDGEAAESLYQRYLLLDQPAVPVLFSQQRIDLFNDAYDTFSESLLDSQIEFACISCLDLMKTFVYRKVNKSKTLSKHENLVNKVKDFITSNLDKSYNATHIAAQFDYSASYIFYVFKKTTGYSIISFFNLKKIQRACEYLAYTDQSVKEISFRMGYEDPLYFSRVFKKYMGTSPRHYRKNA